MIRFAFFILFCNHYLVKAQIQDSSYPRRNLDSVRMRLLMCNYVAEPFSINAPVVACEEGLLCARLYFKRCRNRLTSVEWLNAKDTVAMKSFGDFINIYNDWRIIDMVEVGFYEDESFVYCYGSWNYDHQAPYVNVPLFDRCRIFMSVHPPGSRFLVMKDTIRFEIVVREELMSYYLTPLYTLNFAAVAYEAVFIDVREHFDLLEVCFKNERGGQFRTDTYKLADIPNLIRLPAPLPQKDKE